jgi:hypothetical protein
VVLVLAMAMDSSQAEVQSEAQADTVVTAVPVVDLAAAIAARGLEQADTAAELEAVLATEEQGVAPAAKVPAAALVPDAVAMGSGQSEEKDRAKADMVAVLDITPASHRE